MATPLWLRAQAAIAYWVALHAVLVLALGACEPAEQLFWSFAQNAFFALAPTWSEYISRGYVHEFIALWGRQFQACGSVADRPHIGRPGALPDETALRMVAELLAGYPKDVLIESGPPGRGVRHYERRQYYYRSIAEARTLNVFIRETMSAYGITDSALLRTLRRVCPGLKRRHLHPKRALTAENVAARVALCERLLSMEGAMLHYLCRVCWIDSKTIYICPKEVWVYAPPDADMTAVDPRLPPRASAMKKVNYYCAVNAVLGPVWMEFVTGTTAHEEDPGYKLYMVSAGAGLALLG